jgi:predicted AAA+ superfamily ATPase
VDFVAQSIEGRQAYIQVSYLIADEATRQREFGTLRNIRDNYPKFVISMTPLLTRSDDEGITHLHLHTFLTEGLR